MKKKQSLRKEKIEGTEKGEGKRKRPRPYFYQNTINTQYSYKPLYSVLIRST